MGIPAEIKSPSGDRDGEEVLPVSLHGDGEISPHGDGDGAVTPDGKPALPSHGNCCGLRNVLAWLLFFPLLIN